MSSPTPSATVLSTAVLVPTAPTGSITTLSEAQSATASPAGGVPSPAGSQLYLFTFLTTLLLLLGVSCAIIIRSLILRRRFRRRVQEAIANGVFVPGLMGDRPPRDIGEKPKMFDVWIGEPTGGLSVGPKPDNDETEGWNGILPVAATKVPSDSSPKPPTSSLSTQQPNTQPATIFSRILRRTQPAASTSNSTPSPSALEAQPEKPPSQPSTPKPKDTDPSPVQVSLLIAMPSAARPSTSNNASSSSSSSAAAKLQGLSPAHSDHSLHPDDDPKGKLKASSITSSNPWSSLDEGEIPHLELAVLDLGYRGDKKAD